MNKLTLEELSVKSFITNEQAQEVRGGWSAGISWFEACDTIPTAESTCTFDAC